MFVLGSFAPLLTEQFMYTFLSLANDPGNKMPFHTESLRNRRLIVSGLGDHMGNCDIKCPFSHFFQNLTAIREMVWRERLTFWK